jgi:glyceraldehyde-3-phosphate dehydrogenase (NADP+)
VLCLYREGNLIWPVLLDNVTADMRIAWEEPFGPVLPIMRVPNVDAAVQHCNSSAFGLQGCVFTRDINNAMRISDAMQTGTVQVRWPGCSFGHAWGAGHEVCAVAL